MSDFLLDKQALRAAFEPAGRGSPQRSADEGKTFPFLKGSALYKFSHQVLKLFQRHCVCFVIDCIGKLL